MADPLSGRSEANLLQELHQRILPHGLPLGLGRSNEGVEASKGRLRNFY
jgi:hypothetical protein